MIPIFKLFLQNWRFFVIVITPFVLRPIYFTNPENPDDENDGSPTKYKCAYVILLMGIYWMTEAMPLAITALIPVVLFPLFNVQSTGQVCQNYMRESVMMFLGGISLALAIEYSGLHKRIALRIMTTIGTSPWRLLLGLMVTTMFLSCWIIINTAVAAMMLPIVSGLIQCLEDDNNEMENGIAHSSIDWRKKKKNLNKLFMLAVGYSANIGGTATIIGSNPNLIARELLSAENIGQNGKYTDINFSSWIAFSMPIAIINLFITWIYLGTVYLGLPDWCCTSKIFPRKIRPTTTIHLSMTENGSTKISINNSLNSNPKSTSSSSNINAMLHAKLKELGSLTFHELCVTILFIIVILLWFTRDPQIFEGWSSWFDKSHVKIGDSSVALGIVLIMFTIPKELKLTNDDSHNPSGTLLSWQFVQKNLPWNVILLVGGGFAISDAANKSGLSNWVGEQLGGFESLPNPVILLIFLLIISCLTEIVSNAACTNLLLPILIALSKNLNLHPLYLSLPSAIACQYAFMLPVSNPPNALIFTAGEMKILDMIKAGAFLNFACLTVLFLMNITWGQLIFNYNDYTYA